MKIKAQNYMSITPGISASIAALKEQVNKVLYYIKPIFRAGQFPEDKQQEILKVLNAIQQTVNMSEERLSKTTADKWANLISPLAHLGNLADNLVATYEGAIPQGQLKSVYKTMIIPEIQQIAPLASDLVGLVNAQHESVTHAKQTFNKEDKEVSVAEDKPKEQPKKEEPKEGPTELKEEPKEETLREKEAPKHTEGPTEGAPEPKTKKTKKEPPAKKTREETKELRDLGNKAEAAAYDTIKIIKHFVDLGLKELPTKEAFTEGNKIKDLKKDLNKLHTNLKSLYKKTPEEREALSDDTNDLIVQVKDIIDKTRAELVKNDAGPKQISKYLEDLIKARNALEDVGELLTFGRTFKRASSILKCIAEGEDPKEQIQYIIDMIREKGMEGRTIKYHLLNMFTFLNNIFEDEDPELNEIGAHIKEAEVAFRDGLADETIVHLQEALKEL